MRLFGYIFRGKNVLKNSVIIGVSDPVHVNLTTLMNARTAENAAGARRRLINGRAPLPMKRRRLGGKGGLASGMEGPAYHRLTIDNVTFAEFNHPNTVATTALAKEKFTPNGKYKNIKWKALVVSRL